MTPEQLAALMNWIHHRILDAVENSGVADRATHRACDVLYQKFGFEEGPCGEPVAPGTYPPTSGDRTALTP